VKTPSFYTANQKMDDDDLVLYTRHLIKLENLR